MEGISPASLARSLPRQCVVPDCASGSVVVGGLRRWAPLHSTSTTAEDWVSTWYQTLSLRNNFHDQVQSGASFRFPTVCVGGVTSWP
mmetsp:Transcript_6618/g.16244  ORF Transcript_6618/g.16244 Transcript_6618/m.16244 type:complete len:87 (+) Transcript_6618:2079-2339(+)